MSKKLSLDEKRKLFLLLIEKRARGEELPVFDDYSPVSSDWGVDENGYFLRNDGKHYEASPTQDKFIHCGARFAAFYSPRGGGKTASGAQKALKKIMQGESGAIINPDLENFKFSTWPEFKNWIPWNMVVPRQRYRQSAAWDCTRPFTMVFTNGAKIYCKGLKDPDSARGPNMNWLWYDEAGRDKTGLGWKIAIAGVRIGSIPQAWATYTPKDFYHWSYDFFVKQTISETMKDIIKTMPEGYKLIEWFHGTRDDNKAHLDPMFYASLDSAYPGGWLRTQEVDGDYANEGGALGTRAWFNDHYLDVCPEWVTKKVRFWDLAATEKKIGKPEPDETVGTLFGCDDPAEQFCIENQVGGWWAWEKLKENIRAVARKDGTEIPIYIEQEPASGGKNQVAEITNFLKPEGFTVRPHNPKDDGDRVMAANTWYGEAAQGKYWIVKGLWNEKFLIQVDTFPDAPHDDRITSVSGARHSIAPIRKWKKQTFMAVGLTKASIDNSDDKK
jgi:phage terminase large subunit-like protein